MAIIRKQTGNFLEDFRLGQVFRHRRGKTLTEGLFNAFTDFTMTTNPLAKNRRFAEAHGFDGLVAPPGLVMNVAFSQTVEDVSENARANLEYIDMRFGVPVYVGDTIEVETTILGITPSSRNPDRGVVHVQSAGKSQNGEVVLSFQRKVQVWKKDADAEVDAGTLEDVEAPTASLTLPAYDAAVRDVAHLTAPDGYFEDFHEGDVIEHSRGRTVGSEHIALTAQLDNTSQVHCNQVLIDQNPDKYIGGKLLIYGGIPFNLCLGLSCPDVGENSLGDVRYGTGRHTAPLFEGDTVFARTEIRGTRDLDGRDDLGIVETTLRGHKLVEKDGDWHEVEIFVLERDVAMKRRSHYA